MSPSREDTLYALVRHGSLGLALRFAADGAFEVESCGLPREGRVVKTVPAPHAAPASTPGLESQLVWNPARRCA